MVAVCNKRQDKLSKQKVNMVFTTFVYLIISNKNMAEPHWEVWWIEGGE